MAEFLAGLEGLIEAMQGADTVAAVRGYEGAAAKRIFKRLNQHIAIESFRSPSRQRQNPDRLNSLLNFGYYLLFSRINAALRALGLNPYLGFMMGAMITKSWCAMCRSCFAPASTGWCCG